MSVARGRKETGVETLRPLVAGGVQGERGQMFSAWVVNASGALISRHMFGVGGGEGEGGMTSVLAVELILTGTGEYGFMVSFGVVDGEKLEFPQAVLRSRGTDKHLWHPIGEVPS